MDQTGIGNLRLHKEEELQVSQSFEMDQTRIGYILETLKFEPIQLSQFL